MAKSTAPSGLQIKRKGNKFTFSWSIPKCKYEDGQKAQYRYVYAKNKTEKNNDGWVDIAKVHPTTKSKVVTVNYSKFYPKKDKTLDRIEFRVRGKAKKHEVSNYSTKTFNVNAPKDPKLSVTDGSLYPSAYFSWSVETKDSNSYIFTKVEYQTTLNASPTKEPTSGWSKVTPKTSSSGSTSTITENTAQIAGKSYTRWFRLRTIGPGGTSGWKYERKTYAAPNIATIVPYPKSAATLDATKKVYDVTLAYNMPISNSRPVSKVEIQYTFVTPEWDSSTNMLLCPDDASWTTKVTVAPSGNAIKNGKQGTVAFKTEKLLSEDQCLFARVNLSYNDKELQTTPGAPHELKTGVLKAPTGFSVSYDPDTYRITAAAQNESSVEKSYIVIQRIDGSQRRDIGIIKNGQTSTIIQCAEWTELPSFGAYTVVGSRSSTVSYDMYHLTTDTSVASGKEYYERQGEGTDEDPYSFTTVEMTNNFIEASILDTNETESGLILSHTPNVGSDILLRLKEFAMVGVWDTRNGIQGWQTIYFTAGTPETKQITTWCYMPDGENKILRTHAITYDGGTEFEWTTPVSTDSYYGEMQVSYTVIINPSEEGWYDLPASNITYYNIDAKMKSPVVLDGGRIPSAPTVTAEPTDISGTIRVSWDWSWDEANSAELSWADHDDAWESTSEPSTYTITKMKASSWNISGLETGKMWYVRVRLLYSDNDSATYGAYSKIVDVDLASAPLVPELIVSNETVTQDGKINASWAYSTTDGTKQESAVVAEVVQSETENSTVELVTVGAEQSVTLNVADLNWNVGETHYLVVQVKSESGRTSDGWSNAVPITVAEPPRVMIVDTSLESVQRTTTDEDDQPYTWVESSLTQLPLTIDVIDGYDASDDTTIEKVDTGDYILTSDTTVEEDKNYYIRTGTGTDDDPYDYEPVDEPTGNPSAQGYYEEEQVNKTYYVRSGEGTDADPYIYIVVDNPSGSPVENEWYEQIPIGKDETVTLIIKRRASYHVDRPDETDYYGYEGETVYILSKLGEGDFSVGLTDLIGSFDDNASYVATVTLEDSYGQTVQAPDLEFEIHWEHQAEEPSVVVTTDNDQMITIMTPIAPENADPTDVCDIYRLSVDKPELIYSGATFGVSYVDPYPTIGAYGGHRFVTRTENGDYITQENEFAWVDTREEQGDLFENHSNIIDFEDGRAFVLYEADISNSWKKDFQETQYLGGSIQGDWNKAVSRTSTVSATAVSDYDQELVQTMRRLASHPGVCHVRTKDGSNYTADVQVSETYEYTNGPRLNKYDLSITRVNTSELDGMTLEAWNNLHPEEESE